MISRSEGYTRFAHGILASILCGLSCVMVSACAGHVDDRFSAETFDENSEPLTNAVIGSPAGVVEIGPDGRVIKTLATSAPPPVDGGTGGTGGVGFGSSSGSSSSGSGSGASGGASGSSSGGPIADGGSTFPGDGGVAEAGGFGFWHFDDCSPTTNFLIDSSGEGANAQQALRAACVPGISGLGVEIRKAKDIIQVPDEPQFTVGPRVAVAAWVHPSTVSGDQPIVIKRLGNQTAFSLGIHNGNIQMSVVLSTGKTVISQAPIAAGTWTHVAGMFDGTFVFLFINGQQFGQVFGAGTLRDVFAPIRIGATTQSQHFDGIIDEVFVSTQPTTAEAIEALSCITRPTTFTVSPAVGPPVSFDTSVHYDVAVTDNDVGFCASGRSYDFFVSPPVSTFTINLDSSFQQATGGQTVTFGVDVTATDSAAPDIVQLPFQIFDFGGPPNFPFEDLSGALTFDLVAPSSCFVFTGRELLIRDTSVVDDPVRTFGSTTGGFGLGGGGGVGGVDAGSSPAADAVSGPVADAGTSPSLGAWTFGHLIREAAPSPEQAPAMVLQLFQHWLTDQTVNGFTVAARPTMQQVLLDIWPKTATGDLDLDQAPLTLEAIVNRIDLRDLGAGSAGEGRFVFGVNGQAFQSFTVILEYNLPAQTQQDITDWANRWHSLSSHPFPSEEYNAALEAITRRFTDRGASPGSVNGSALVSLRTNEIALSFQWELRQFLLSSNTGFLDEIPLTETPDLGFNGTQTFSDFVNQNAAGIIAEVPGAAGTNVTPQFEGASFQAGSVFNNLIEWNGPGIADPDARFHASANTCNGCHGPETNTVFLMVTPRFPGSPASLSPFLTGTTAFDQFSGQVRTLNDLGRRQADLTSLVCGEDGGTTPPPPPVDAGSPPPPVDAGSPPPAVDASPPPSLDAGASPPRERVAAAN
jgi:Concanavalin A-like lectin/glucanases superfamily